MFKANYYYFISGLFIFVIKLINFWVQIQESNQMIFFSTEELRKRRNPKKNYKKSTHKARNVKNNKKIINRYVRGITFIFCMSC